MTGGLHRANVFYEDRGVILIPPHLGYVTVLDFAVVGMLAVRAMDSVVSVELCTELEIEEFPAGSAFELKEASHEESPYLNFIWICGAKEPEAPCPYLFFTKIIALLTTKIKQKNQQFVSC